MQSLFFFFLSIFTTFAPVKLALKSYIEPDINLNVYELDEQNFMETDYLNANSRNGVLWVETEIPEELEDHNLQCLLLGHEYLHKATVYVQDENKNWITVGKTGDGYKYSEKSISGYYHSISLNGETYRTETYRKLKIRIKIISPTSSLFSVYTMRLRDLHKITTLNSTILVFILGIFFITLVYNLYFNFSLFNIRIRPILFICLFSFMLILQYERLIENYFTPSILKGIHCYRLTLVLICGLGASLTRDQYILMKEKIGKLSILYKKISNVTVYFYISAFTLSIVLYTLSVPYSIESILNIIIISIIYLIINFNSYFIIKHTGKKNIKTVILYNIAFSIIFLHVTFFHFRFFLPQKDLFKFFDNSVSTAALISTFCVYYASLLKFNNTLKTSINFLKEKEKENSLFIAETKVKNYILKNLFINLANPMQYLSSTAIEIKDHISPSASNRLTKTINYTADLLKSISLLAKFETTSSTILFEQEPIDLSHLTSEGLAAGISILQHNGCYVNITENYRDGIYVYANRSLLIITLNFILDTVVRKAFNKSNIQISSEYENFTFIFTVEFECENIPANFAKDYFNQETIADSEELLYEINQSWGTQLYIAKKIIETQNGNIVLYPTTSGVAIQLRIALKSYFADTDQYMLHNIDELEQQENDEIIDIDDKKTNKQSIFILEEDDNLRKNCKKLLNNEYNLRFFTYTDELLEATENSYPDLIFYSFSAPGTPLIQLISENPKLTSIPSIVTAKEISRRNTIQLLCLGISEIMIKPFPVDFLYYKTNSIMKNRLMHREIIIKSITETFRNNYMPSDSKESESASIITASVNSSEENYIESSDFVATLDSANLTTKEKIIACLIAEGKSDKEIAAELNISTGTVAVHNKNLYKKLKIHSRAELIKKSGR